MPGEHKFRGEQLPKKEAKEPAESELELVRHLQNQPEEDILEALRGYNAKHHFQLDTSGKSNIYGVTNLFADEKGIPSLTKIISTEGTDFVVEFLGSLNTNEEGTKYGWVVVYRKDDKGYQKVDLDAEKIHNR